MQYAGQANFICVGCAGPALSKEMGKQMKLASCVNGFIADQKSMPKWGQLGCNGFIVLNADQSVACPATSAFMELRELAFLHVQTLVDALVQGLPVPPFCPGENVCQGNKKRPAPCLFPLLCVVD